MPDTSTSILLKIQADLAGLTDMAKGFVTAKQEVKGTTEEVSKLDSKLTETGHSLLEFGAAFGIATIGIQAITEKIGEAVNGSSRLADEMWRVTRATGLAGDATQVLAAGGKMAFSELAMHLQQYRAALGAALIDPKGPQAAMFGSQLGLDPKALDALPMQQQLEELARSFSKISSENEKARLSMTLFGRFAGPMLDVLKTLNEQGFDAMSKSVQKTAGILSKEMSDALVETAFAGEHASNRLSIAFAPMNLRLLEWKADITRFLADYGAAISAIGEGLTTAAVGFGAFSGLSKMLSIMPGLAVPLGRGFAAKWSMGMISWNWASVGKSISSALFSPMGAALTVALGAIIIASIRDSVLKGIEEADTKLAEIYGKGNQIRNAAKTATSAGGVDTANDAARKEIDDLIAKRDALMKGRYKDQVVGTNMGGGTVTVGKTDTFGDNERKQVVAYNQEISNLETQLKEKVTARLKVEAAARGEKEKQAAAETAALDKAKETTAELDKQKDAYANQIETAQYTLADNQKKQVMIDAEKAKAEEIYKIDLAAARLVGDDNAIEAAGLKLQETKLEIGAKQGALDTKIADEKKKAADDQIAAAKKVEEAELKATRAQIDVQKLALENKQDEIQLRLANIDADFTHTDAEKWNARKQALDDSVVAAKEYLKQMQDIRSHAVSPEAIAIGDTNVAGASRDLGRAQGDAANAGPNPNNLSQSVTASMTQLQNGFKTIGSSIADVMGSAINSVSGSIEGLLNKTMTVGQAVNGVFLGIAKTVVKSISDMAAQWVIKHTLMAAVSAIFRTKEVVGTIATEGTKTAVTVGGATSRIAASNAESGSSLIQAGIKGMTAVASIPYVGPFLAIAALAAIIAAGAAVMKKNFRDGGPVNYADGGGAVVGPGGPKDDKIDARLSNGEYVQTAEVAQNPKYRWLMGLNEAARLGKKIPGFKTGGWLGKMLFTGIDDKLVSIYRGPQSQTGTVSDTRTDAQRAAQADVYVQSGGSAAAGGALKSTTGGASGVVTGSSGSGQTVNVAHFGNEQSAEQWLQTMPGRRFMNDYIKGVQYELA
jgi:hypothetical protein